ncbi:hypothetical protein [Nitrosomonas sp.]
MKSVLTNLAIAAAAATVGMVVMDAFFTIIEQYRVIGDVLGNFGNGK